MQQKRITYHIKMTTRTNPWLLIILMLVTITSCKKDFLDDKPRTDIIIPETLEDFQQLLDNYIIMNETPQLG